MDTDLYIGLPLVYQLEQAGNKLVKVPIFSISVIVKEH